MSVAITQSPSEAQSRITGVETLETLDASVIGTATAVVLARKLALKKYVIKGLRLNVGTTGSAGTTTAVANIDGVAVTGLTVSIANTDTDGTTKVDGPTSETVVDAGSVMDIELTAVATANADVTAQLILAEAKE